MSGSCCEVVFYEKAYANVLARDGACERVREWEGVCCGPWSCKNIRMRWCCEMVSVRRHMQMCLREMVRVRGCVSGRVCVVVHGVVRTFV